MLVEREPELATLHEMVADALRGHARLVFVGGEAGVGKTALVTQLCAASPNGVVVRRGAAENFPTAEALGAFVDAFPELEDLLGAGGAQDRARLFRRVRAELSGSPTVLVLEDIHWADESTCELLRFIGRRLDGLCALVLATFRDDEVSAHHPVSALLGELAGAPDVVRMTVRALTPSAVTQLVSAAGSRLDPTDLYRRTGGNPFFVTEIVAAGTEEIPRTVRDAVIARASRLSPAAWEVLCAAAILRRRANARLIAAVAEQAPSAVDECIQHGVLVEDGDGVAFRHELARLTVEQALLPGARQSLHERALRALLVHAPHDARALAHHAAECGDDEHVLEYAPRAAEHAAGLGAHREAAAHYRSALRVKTVPRDVRGQLFEQLSYECYLTDELVEAVAARRRALELFELAGDAEKVGASERWLSRLSWFVGLAEDSHRYARRAVATLAPLGDGHELAMAYSNMAQLSMLAQDMPAALEWGERALELARRLDDLDVEIHALNNTGMAHLLGDSVAEGLTRITRSLDLALATNAHEHAARAYTNLGSAAAASRRTSDADNYLRAGIAYCDEYDLRSWGHYMNAQLGMSLAEQGRYDEALHVCSVVLDHPRVAAISRIPASVVISQVGARLDRPEPALLDTAEELALATGESQRLVPVAVARAEAAWLAGDPAGVVAGVDLGWDTAVNHPDRWQLGELAWWLSAVGVTRELPIPVGAPFALMLAGKWHEAAELWEHLSCPLWTALCLARCPELDAARRALQLVDGLRARAVRDPLLRDRQRLGLPAPRTPRTTSRSNAALLTVREVEVLRLVADGLSNREVAQRLFISVKTVGHHMSSALRKLDQPTRGRAVAEAHRMGILTRT